MPSLVSSESGVSSVDALVCSDKSPLAFIVRPVECLIVLLKCLVFREGDGCSLEILPGKGE